MDPICKKNYCTHEMDAKKYFETYYSAHTPYSIIKETTINIVRELSKAFCSGIVTGTTVLDFSVSPTAFHLCAICDFVEKIIVLKVNDGSLKELEKWKNKDEDAFDWAHIKEFVQAFKGNSDELEDKEEKLREKIDQIMKWDPSKSDPADVCRQPEDKIIVMNYGVIEFMSNNHDEYRSNLRKMINCMKSGEYFLSYAPSNASYFKVGEDKYHLLHCDERFYRKATSEEGLEIVYFKKFAREMGADNADHGGANFFIACKVKP